MAEQTFRSPGFFEREIDASTRVTSISGTPAGVIGTAEKGPAFIPVTVGSMQDFLNRFGDMDSKRFGPYAVEAWLKSRTALTYMRVLGAGSNETTADIETTRDTGTVKRAGFVVSGSLQVIQRPAGSSTQAEGAVQFIAARHYVSGNTDYSNPQFIDNPSFGLTGAGQVNLIRAVVFMASGSRLQVMDIGDEWEPAMDDVAQIVQSSGLFGLAISSSASDAKKNWNEFTAQAGAGVRILTASLDPSNDNYISKVLNTDATKFYQEKHVLYLDFAVENEMANVGWGPQGVSVLSGSGNNLKNQLGSTAGKTALWGFGRYDTRYTTPRTPAIISQPYGGTEHALFHFEALSDGVYGNDKVKVSIANLRASTNKNYQYPTFEVQVRKFDDTDTEMQVLESYPECTLDPDSENFVGRKVGDYKAWYNFDADQEDEKRIIVSGRYPNQSVHVRVVLNAKVYSKDLPSNAMPFGFGGIPVLKTSDSLTNTTQAALSVDGVRYGNTGNTRLWGSGSHDGYNPLTGSIVPPLPFRFKVTRGAAKTGSVAFSGQPSSSEIVDGRFYWGVKFTRCPKTGSMDNARINPNAGSLPNPIIKAYTRFNGIAKLDTVVTGAAKDTFNANKFTLAKVALAGTGSQPSTLLQYVTASAREHMLEAAYIRNGVPDSQTYAVNDPDGWGYRVTLATLAQSSSVKFNRFTSYAKFTMPLYGGFDGVCILDSDMYYMNDRSASTDSTSNGMTGKASSEWNAGESGLMANPAGTGRLNNAISAYRKAATIMTDPLTVRTNLLAIPGIRDAFVTDHASEKTRDYSMAMYVMDIPQWTESTTRLFGAEDRSKIASASYAFPDVRETAEQFESRAIDNNYVATYFPDVYINDSTSDESVKVPPSVVVMGALSYNDQVAYPWFAPAGFNRGGLSTVTNTDVRLSAEDRDTLYDARINPIANFSDGSYVVWGQKTCQLRQSALDRVNVRRMMLELKRQVVTVANRILFEPNNAATRNRFINLVSPLLAAIQTQQGIESWKIVMDDTNNSQEDVESNRLNGRIVVVPTRAIEFIAIDFIITNSGVDFAQCIVKNETGDFCKWLNLRLRVLVFPQEKLI